MKNELTHREFHLANNMLDKSITTKKVILNITKTLPVIIASDEVISNNSILIKTTTPVLPQDLKCFIIDNEYSSINAGDRFIYITSIYSHTTNNINLLYYDKMFSDIIVIPNMSYLDIVDTHTVFKINGYRIGSNVNTSDRDITMSLPTTNDTIVKLPQVKENITSRSILANIAGSYVDNNSKGNSIEVLKDGVFNLTYMDTPPITIIDLGLYTDIFEDIVNLPTYLLHGMSPSIYGLHYLNSMNISTKKLYLALRF